MPRKAHETDRAIRASCSSMAEQLEVKRLALIVEDEALIAMEMEDVLAAEGFACTVAIDQAEVEALSVGKLAVAIVNLRLRGDVVGQSIIRLLRSRIRNLPVVVVTGYNGQAPQADLRGLGGPTIRLQKPVDSTDLARAVREVIDLAHRGTTLPSHRRREDGFRHAAC
jgi:ActR/RegA family two-component response regulator